MPMTHHMKLLGLYAEELAKAQAFATSWWTGLLQAHHVTEKSAQWKQSELARRWPAGPASHPRVLAVIRKYWLACDALNQALPSGAGRTESPEPSYTLVLDEEAAPPAPAEADDTHFVDPHVFVSEWLTDDHEDLALFIGRLPYWPIGLDSQDRYI
jgi:hypothetical protein